MTVHQILLSMENDLNYLTLLKRGVIPLSVLDKKVYYEFYTNELKNTEHKAQAITNTAEEYKVSEMTIRRAIDFMN